jgi:hypothetical protein
MTWVCTYIIIHLESHPCLLCRTWGYLFSGHGPFSHLWEEFVKKANPKSDWKHENNSIKMLDHLIKENDLMPMLKKLGGLDEQDILFIKEQIVGPIDESTGLPMREWNENDLVWHYRGRTEEKSFLYDIVANKSSGMNNSLLFQLRAY